MAISRGPTPTAKLFILGYHTFVHIFTLLGPWYVNSSTSFNLFSEGTPYMDSSEFSVLRAGAVIAILSALFGFCLFAYFNSRRAPFAWKILVAEGSICMVAGAVAIISFAVNTPLRDRRDSQVYGNAFFAQVNGFFISICLVLIGFYFRVEEYPLPATQRSYVHQV